MSADARKICVDLFDAPFTEPRERPLRHTRTARAIARYEALKTVSFD